MSSNESSESSFHSSSKDNSSVSGTSTTGTGHSTRSKLSAAEEEELAKNESKYVFMSKILVLTVLLMSTVIAGTLAYIFSEKSEIKTFEIQVRMTNFAVDASCCVFTTHHSRLTTYLLSFTYATLSSLMTMPTRLRISRTTTPRSSGSLWIPSAQP